MKNFRLNHLRFEHLAIVAEKGYDAQQNHLIALKFLAWYAKEYNVEIRTCKSEGGEKKIRDYSLDGYIKEEDKGIEVHGCYYHACEYCYQHDQTVLAQGRTAGMIRERDAKRLKYLRSCLDVEVYYECEIYEMLEENLEIQNFSTNIMMWAP